MASASKQTVAKKLGIKPGHRIAVLYSPKGYTSILAKLPPQVSLTTRLAGDPFDIIQGFYEDERSLKADLRKFRKAIYPWGKVWICWRKGNVTELNRDSIMELCEGVKLDSVASCAIDDEWSALKLMLPKTERRNQPKITT
jgi:23S rRNA A2030 N6-methylase RlmJ